MPSLKPRVVRPVGSCLTSCCQITSTPGLSRKASRARARAASSRASSGASAEMTRWTSGVPKGGSQLAGALSPTSPRASARAAMPCRNSSGKLSSESWGTPRARRPFQVKATATQASWFGLALGRPLSIAGSSHPRNFASRVPVVDAQEDVFAHVRRRPVVQRPALDVVDLDADGRSAACCCIHD